MNRPLTLRAEATREITARLMSVRASSADEKTRSVEVVMATETPVSVFDWERCGVIDEVLLADGGQFPASMPLLANHERCSLDNVLGSARDPRREGSKWIGRAYFVKDDEDADRAWNKTKQGALTDVSIGYRAIEFDDIPANETRAVNGVSYTAGQRTLRITRRWEAKELSLVPIGADRNAKVRNDSAASTRKEGRPMNAELLKFLKSIGLRSDATAEQAKAFLESLGGVQRARADDVDAKRMSADAAIAAISDVIEQVDSDLDDEAEDTTGSGERDDATTEDDTMEGGSGDRSTPRLNTRGANGRRNRPQTDRVREDATRAERQRMITIRKLGGTDVTPELVTRAIDEGWNTERASREFLTSIRERRSPSVGADNGAPAGIVRKHERDCTSRSLGVAMAMRSGIDVQRWAKRNNVQGWENIASQADRFNDMSMVDVCREALRIGGRDIPYKRDEMIRAAVSGGELTNIFTTAINATLMQSWEEQEDTTLGWVEEVDEAGFLQASAIQFNGQTNLEKLGRGGTANDASPSDKVETYQVARFAKKFSVDEMDIIDDRFSALMAYPTEFGAAARRLRPDLIYAILLANPTLNATAGALFNSTALTSSAGHANLQTGALTASTLQASVVAMAKQYLKNGKAQVNLNLKPAFLIVPQDLLFTAGIILSSAERPVGNNDGSFNPLKDMVQLRADNRIGVTGVTDPNTGTAYTGTATNYFLAAKPGRTLRVAYRRGTGRAPALRSYVLDKGQWGIGWDVNMDIGAKAMDFRGLIKSTGA